MQKSAAAEQAELEDEVTVKQIGFLFKNGKL